MQADQPATDSDLNKAYVGFTCDTHGQSIATGNWGCGAFFGAHTVNSLIQIVAATVASKDLIYTTFGNRQIAGLADFMAELCRNGVTVRDVVRLLSARTGWARNASLGEILNALIEARRGEADNALTLKIQSTTTDSQLPVDTSQPPNDSSDSEIVIL